VSRRISSADRVRDLIALVILLAGAALAGHGWLHLREMSHDHIVRHAGQSALQQADHYYSLTRTGVLIMLAGVGAMAYSSWRYARARDT
jgi:uncharacterized membrane protein YidH (DUF202 family)